MVFVDLHHGLDLIRLGAINPHFPVRPDGAYHQWRRVPPGELSIAPVADERLGRVTDRAGAS